MPNAVHKNDMPAVFSYKDKGVVAVDTETMGLSPFRDRLCVAQLCFGDGNAHLVQFDGTDYSAPNLRAMLKDESVVKIFHFARFDMATLKHHLNVDVANVYCTKIASYLARTYTDAHGLKDLCGELLEVKISKQQQSSDWGAKTLSKEQIAYAADDVLYLHRLKDRLDAMLEREGRTDLAKRCFSFLPTRVALDLAGWNEKDVFAHSLK
ncbi:MAG: ribonuclease D [Rickettsiales bacterium]